MKYKLIFFVIIIVIASFFLTSYFAKRNLAVCRFIGGKLETLKEDCRCTSQPCLATVCRHVNKCVWGK